MRSFVPLGVVFGFLAGGIGAGMVFLLDYDTHRDYAVVATLMAAVHGAVAGFILGALVALVAARVLRGSRVSVGRSAVVIAVGALAAVTGYLVVATAPLAPVPRPSVPTTVVILLCGAFASALPVRRRSRANTN
ncbi:hypothetical protein DY023_04565 [Microbacterium bovistercoris]|uniref:Uncharacterized protein n=1 Tax=Microbacterium bovistercoris TaxID=2293570 RepID=A0A371NXJ9_9MICO|nr:hypothetical protein [Microbacterium bovistercoris]REJ06980.1 hypothetical protein DY023_04565 [Microbacterium bovistercoris]